MKKNYLLEKFTRERKARKEWPNIDRHKTIERLLDKYKPSRELKDKAISNKKAENKQSLK